MLTGGNDAILSMLPAGPFERRLALWVLLVSVAIFIALAPFAKVPLAQVPAFLPLYQSALCINDAMTALLLFGQARAARSRSLLVLASGYVFTALITLAHLLTYPAVFSPTGLLGAGLQSTAWLYMFWHAGFPLVVIAFAIIERGALERTPVNSVSISKGMLAATLAAAALTLLATLGHDLLPEVIFRNRYTGVYPYVAGTVWALPMIAAAVLWRRRPHTVLDVWLMVVMCAWVFEIALGAVLNGGRYDLGFYFGRVYGLLAASFVLMVLLFEHSVLYARLLEARTAERRKTRELVAATAEMAARREQESAQKLLDAVVRQMPGGVVIADETGKRIFANEKAQEILGFPILTLDSSEEFDAIVQPDGSPLQRRDYPLARALGGETIIDQEIVLVREDASRRILAMSAAPVHDVEGRLVGAVSAFTDITARKAAEEERAQLLVREKQARAEAEIANRSKDEFLAMLGHELRNPLSPIRTALQLMRMRGDTALMAERVIIERQVEHLVRLVDDLLDVSRITSGKIELKRELCEVADIVAKAIEMAGPLIAQRRHRLDVSVPRAMAIWCDPARLAQVVCNLLINAAKYTEAKGEIAIAATRDGDDIVLSVRDNGIGVTPELLERMFEPFVQGRQNLERSQGGLGLGLAIVRSIVTLHRGSVSARSNSPARGSEFVVRIPAGTGEHAPPRAPRADAASPILAAPDGMRVLLVDDNVDAANMLAIGLGAHGIHVDLAHDGPAALRSSRERRHHVALLDLGLPVMDGFEVARRLRQDPETAHMALVAITGYGEQSDRQKTRDAGFTAHLVKPVDIEDVLGVIRDAQNRPSP